MDQSSSENGKVVNMQQQIQQDTEQNALEMYQIVFNIARHFIEQSKLYSIEELLEHNDPTYEEIAKNTKALAKLMESVADLGGWNEERIALNAKQSAIYMSQMAIAIVQNNENDLKIARSHLESITFI